MLQIRPDENRPHVRVCARLTGFEAREADFQVETGDTARFATPPVQPGAQARCVGKHERKRVTSPLKRSYSTDVDSLGAQ